MQRTSHLCILALLAAVSACGEPSASETQGSAPAPAMDAVTMTDVHIQSADQQWTVRLTDSAATRDFVALLPLHLELTDHAGTEKISDLPAPLSREGAPAAATPRTGDVGYYAPWGNLAIYHQDFRSSPGLILLGHIDGDVSGFSGPDPMRVTITRVDQPAGSR